MLPIHVSLSLQLFIDLSTTSNTQSSTADLLSLCLKGLETEEGQTSLDNFLDEVLHLLRSDPRTYLLSLNRFLDYIRGVLEKFGDADPDVTNQLANRSSAFLLPFYRRVVGPMLKSLGTVSDITYLVAYFVRVLVQTNDCIKVARAFFHDIIDMLGVAEILLTDSTGHRFVKQFFIHFRLHSDPLVLHFVDRLHNFAKDCSVKAKLPDDVLAYMEIYEACNTLLEVIQLQAARFQGSSALGHARENFTATERLYSAKVILPKKDRGNENYYAGKNAKQQSKPSLDLILFTERQLRYFQIVGVKPPSMIEQLNDTFSRIETIKKGLLMLYVDSSIFPNHIFHKLAHNLLPDVSPPKSQPVIPEPPDQMTTSLLNNQNSTSVPLSPNKSDTSFSPSSTSPESPGQHEDDLGPWTILLSDKAVTDLHNLRSEESFKTVRKKLQELAAGFWTSDNAKQLVHGPMNQQNFGVSMFEAKTFHNQRIIWQVDVAYVQRLNATAQVIKVWAIGSHKHVDTMMDKYLWMVHLGYSEEQKRRCGMRSSTKRGKNGTLQQMLPLVFDAGVEGGDPVVLDRMIVEEAIKDHKTLTEEDLLELHNLRVTTKFVPLSKTLVKSILAGSTDFAFSVSRQEHQIIQYPSSAIVIGRSGTGKTTTIVFRMLALHQAYHSHATECLYKSPSFPEPERTHLRQIFLTQSAVLCTRVRAYFQRLLSSTDRANLSKEQIMSAARHRLAEDREGAMLEDDDEELLANVPKCMNDLGDEHFPLFLTMSKFLEMLEGTYKIRHVGGPQARTSAARRFTMRGGADFKRFPQGGENDKNKDVWDDDDTDDDGEESSIPLTASIKGIKDVLDIQPSWAHYVTYEVFESKYWPRMNEKLVRNLDCALVFSEIMSVIKGSNAVLSTDKGHLSREEYVHLSRKMYPGLCYAREHVYDIFQQYQKMKARFEDFDVPDRSFAVFQAINREGYHSTALHEIYVDECQDNTMCDYAVLMKLVSDPNGLFFAGDTAQAVARGSLFRFADLSSLVYRNEQQHPHVMAGFRKPVQPQLFQLTTNYRSHNGILQLGAHVIQLLHYFFPSTIDKLEKERGIVNGPKPIFFDNFTADSFHFEFFCFGERSDEFIEFGAEQCIIVRNETAKERLRQRIGNVGLVMTVYEAKGLEFTDTLLYNFWQDSPAQNKWRVVSSTLDSGKIDSPVFDYEKHAIISDELKQLYVAITRTRSHLWIFDENMEYSEPMKKVWMSNGLVQVVNKDDRLPSLGAKSSRADWEKQGRNLFERRQYEHSMVCFAKSGNQDAMALAEAYVLREKARRLASRSDNRNAVNAAFTKAASAFEKCQRPRRAAECYQVIGMYHEAGECFKQARMFEDSVLMFQIGGYFDEAVDLLESESNEISLEIANKVRRIVCLFYLKTQQLEKVGRLGMTLEEMVNLYIEHNMLRQLADLYEEKKMFIEAGNTLRLLDRLEAAASLYAKDESQQGITSALECYSTLASRNSPRLFELKNTTERELLSEDAQCENQQRVILAEAEVLINMESTKSFLKASPSSKLDFVVHEIQIFRSQLDRSTYSLRSCANFFHGKSVINEHRALEIYFGFALNTYNENISMDDWKAELQLMMRFCDCVFILLKAMHQSSKTENWEELCCVDAKKIDKPTIDRRVHTRSPLIPIIEFGVDTRSLESQPTDNEFLLCSYDQLKLAAQRLLCTRLWDFIIDVGDFSRKTLKWFQDPCFHYSVFKECRLSDCKHEHIENLEPKSFYKRRSLLLLQVEFIHNLSKLNHYGNFVLVTQLSQYKPILRAWYETWVRHIQIYTMEIDSADVLRKVTSNTSTALGYEFLNLISNVWLKFLDPRDFNPITRAVLLIQAGPDKSLRKWICHRISNFEREMTQAYPNAPPQGMTSKVNRQNWFWMVTPFVQFFENMEGGDIKKALMNGDNFLRFCFQVSNSNEFSLDPWHLIYLLEYITTLLVFIKSEGHNILLPRSFLQCFIRDNVQVLLQSAISEEWHDGSLHRFCIGACHRILHFICVLGNLSSFNLRHLIMSQILIARVIRLSVILGCNDMNRSGTVIMKFYKTTNSIHSSLHPLIHKYFEAKSWKEMVSVLQNQYLKANRMDELVMVRREGKVPLWHVADSLSSVSVMRYINADGFGTALDEIYRKITVEFETASDALTPKPSSFDNVLAHLKALKTTAVHGIKFHPQHFTVKDPEPTPGIPYADEPTFQNMDDQVGEVMQEDEDFNPFTAYELVSTTNSNAFTAHDELVSTTNSNVINDAVWAVQVIRKWFYKHKAKATKRTTHVDTGFQEVYVKMVDLARRLPESPEKRLYAVMLRGQVADLYSEIIRFNSTLNRILSGMQGKLNNLSPIELDRYLKDIDECNIKRELINHSLTALSPENPDHMIVRVDRLVEDYDQACEALEDARAWSAMLEKGKKRGEKNGGKKNTNRGGVSKKVKKRPVLNTSDV